MDHVRRRRTLRAGALALVTALLAALMVAATAPTAGGVPAFGNAAVSQVGTAPQQPERVHFWLTILHNNDGESALLEHTVTMDEETFGPFGGVARFKTVVDNLKREATTGPSAHPGAKRGVLMISSGDNFLAGPEFSVSLDKGVPFFDTIAMDLIGYNAVTIGNHEFDFGPDVLADFIEGFERVPPFLSANLNVSDEPRLQLLADQGIILKSVVVRERGERIGIVGATTPFLPFISSPRNVKVDPDVAGVVQEEIDRLRASGVRMIILSSHLQTIQEELELIGDLRGVDVVIAGGGDELLADADTLLIPGDEDEIFGPYPLMEEAADGTMVPVVTTTGDYRYVGRLILGFDRAGNVVAVDESSGLVRVSGTAPDAVEPDPVVLARITEPLEEALSDLAENVIAESEVALDGRRSQVRTVETNQGNLIADSLLWQSTQLAPDFGVPTPDIALQNGGGIRNDSLIPAGDITELDTFAMVPFPNFVSVVPDVSRETFKLILENAVSRVEFGDGRFAQVSGFTYVWDAAQQPQTRDEVGIIIEEGERVRDVTLADGTQIVVNGAVVPGDDLHIATIDFLARGGDQYPFGDVPFTTLGVTYQQALANYLQGPLGGLVTAADYPEGGEGRVIRLN
jgi:2',3'-cyclic-nucleotide 2'-phosphodiesterase (5'-nucleotidase family)